MRSPRHSVKALSTADSGIAAVRFLDRLVENGEEPRLGAHIISPRRGYLHHGIYIGNGRVVHYAGMAYGLIRGPVVEATLAEFARGRSVWTRWRRPATFDRTEIVRRALSRVGEDRYQILRNNCEHFCEWCTHGESRSYQVECLLSSWRALVIILALIARLEEFCARLRLASECCSRRCQVLSGEARVSPFEAE
jgi:Lecithin retinol acyltransferase